MFSVLSGIIFLVGLGAQIGMTVARHRRDRLDRPALAWNAIYGAMLAWLATFGLVGLLDGDGLGLLSSVASACLLVLLSWQTVGGARDRLLACLSPGGTGFRGRHRWELGLLLSFCLMSVLTIELPWSRALPLRGPSFWWIELALVTLASCSLYLVSGRRGAGVLPAHALFFVIGLSQYFVRQFKNSAILPNDVLALGTAVSVGGQYRYGMDPRSVIGVAVSCVAVYALSLLSRRWTAGAPAGPRRRGIEVGSGLACAGLCAVLVAVPSYMGALGVEIKYWYSINYYEEQGFLPTFIAICQDMPIREPDGYTEEAARQALDELSAQYEEESVGDEARGAATEQFSEDAPTIVAVMNESFADLSEYDGIRAAGYRGPRFFKTLPDALFRGRLFVNVHGGGTCNSEFEYLTGNSLGYIGAGKYPYSSFKMGSIDSLAKQLGRIGYSTAAIHPNYASNWNRDTVYPDLGFDRFLDIDDFGGFPERLLDGTKAGTTPTGVPVLHSGVTDRATYEKVLGLLDEDAAPQFVFDVTMQNHGSYNQGNIPTDRLTAYVPDGVYDDPEFTETPERLNEYLSCVEASDKDLEWFVSELRKLDRKVVLVFFGDHQPSLTPPYNDAWYAGEDALTHSQRIYHANYFVWANYDVAGASQTSRQRDMSVDGLASATLEAIGAPLSEYQMAQLQTQKSIRAINLNGYLGSDGKWYAEDEDSDYAEAYGRMALVEHLSFAAKL